MLAKKLKIGDTIGVIAPDKALKEKDRESFNNATKYFESLGLKVKFGNFLFSEDSYCAGSAKDRAGDLNDMFLDSDVSAIFTVKGGSLANGILPYIDFDAIKNNPKIICGMSDNTVLLCAINKMTGLITFHCQDYIWFGSPNVTEFDKESLIDKFFNGGCIIKKYDERNYFNIDGVVKGKLYGTNCRGLLKLAGTPYMPVLNNSILFLEGFYMDLLQWNTMLVQLTQININIVAFVFGYLYPLQEENDSNVIVSEMLDIDSNALVVKCNDFGHLHGNSIIPIGVDVSIDSSIDTFTIDNYLM